MTIPGIDSVVALSIVSPSETSPAFARPDTPVSYLGLNPKVRQSGERPPSGDASSKPAAPTPEA
jgi:transposase